MLKQVGIDSYYVLIDTERGVVNPKGPSIYFNHAILAIKLPDSMPDAGLFSVMTTQHAGRIMFFDPTNDVVPLGYLPFYLQDNYGLVITPTGRDMVPLPLAAPVTNRLLRTATLNLAPSGSLTGEVRELRFDQFSSSESLANAARQAHQRKYQNFLIVDVDSHHYESESYGEVFKYIENPVIRRDERGPDQDGRARAQRPRSQVQPAAPHRGGAGRGRRLRRSQRLPALQGMTA